ncbi:MAG: S8 family serine peptidase [bacterium]
MLKKLFTRFVNIFRHPIILSWILAIMVFSIHFPLAKAQVSESKSDPEGKKYVWYKGSQQKYIRLADDEIAIFPRQRANRTRGVLEKAVKDLGFGGEIVKQNEFVMYMKLSKRRTHWEIETMTGERQKEEEIQCISPVFYSGSKDSGTRMALTGQIIIHFSLDWDRSKIEGWSKKKGLSLIKSFDFSPNTFLFDAGSPMKSLELANDIYLSGEVLYSYPNWLKTRVTREEFYKNSHEGFDDKKIRDKGKESNEKSIRKIREKNKARVDTKEQREHMLPSEKQEEEEDTSAHNIVNRSVTKSIATCYPWSENFSTGSTGGIYGGYDKDIYIEGIDGDEGIELRGFAKFDISSIPDNSIIYDVELHVYCFKDVGMPKVAIRKLNSDPVVASWETIFEEGGNGTLYVNNWPFSDGYFDTGQWNVKSLGQMAAMDLQAALGQDWFALGFEQDDFSTSSYAWCYGWDSFLYKPYIVVHYDPLPCQDDDPLFTIQWHLKNTGQCGIAGEDVNIYPVWSIYQGSSSMVAIVDSGVEIAHEDLIENVLPDLCWDYLDKDKDPTSRIAHGTACAGIAAARGWNCLGGRGAAPFCKIVGYRFIGAETEENEADALSRNNDIVDIYVNSWGPPDTGKDLIGPDPLTEASLADSAVNGRGGLGNIYVWAGGNGYENKDNSNYDGYTNSRYTIAVAASDDLGKHPYYSEKGANILINAPSSEGNCGITTCDLTGLDGYNSGNYTSQFSGTSASAPLVSGIIALMLEANPNLSWRDVQHILIKTAEQNDPTDPDWEINGAGYHVNHIYGFGRVDAEKAITTSLSWESVGPEVSIEKSSCPNIAIPDSNIIGVSDTMLIDKNIKIEFIEVYFSAADHSNWGDLEIELISPMGTSSILAEKHDSNGTSTYDNWRFGTIRHFGEDSKGSWKLNVKDLAYIDRGTFQKWSLKIFGHADPDDPPEPPEILSISTNPSPLCGNVPLEVNFNVDAVDPDGNIDSYVFYFTDNNQIITDSKFPQTNFTIERESIKPIAFEIGVCIKDNDGLKDCDTIPITLIPPGYHIEASGIIGIEGGAIEVLDLASILYGSKVSFSKNILNKDVVITISRVEACPPFPDQYIGIGNPIDCGPSIYLQSPATITMTYDVIEVQEKGITNPQDLLIYFFDISKSEWIPIENSKVDLENQSISAKTKYSTLFRIGYEKSENQGIHNNKNETMGGGCFMKSVNH